MSQDQLANIAEFARAVASTDGGKRRLVGASSKAGRCPKSHKAWLRALLSEPKDRAPTPSAVALGATKVEIPLDDSTWPIDDMPRLISRLSQIPDRAGELTIKLGSFTYASALAVLAEWILAHNYVTHFEIDAPPEMDEYLERISFRRALSDRQIRISNDPMDWAVGLTRINRDLPTHVVTEKIIEIIDTFVNPDPQDRQALHILLAEMIENVHRHAEITDDGFAVAQVYPRRLKMGITLVDAGIGVKESLRMGPATPRGLRDDADFLAFACQLHATSKPDRHSGYGLYLLSEVIARNRGTFSLTSGLATLTGYSKHGRLAFERISHRPWQGTIVSVIINLHERLPILDVYREMPAPSGYTDDDFFVS